MVRIVGTMLLTGLLATGACWTPDVDVNLDTKVKLEDIDKLEAMTENLKDAVAAIDLFGVKSSVERADTLRVKNETLEQSLSALQDQIRFYVANPAQVPRYRLEYGLRGHTELLVMIVKVGESTGFEFIHPTLAEGTTPQMDPSYLTNRTFDDANLAPGTYELLVKCVDVESGARMPASVEVRLHELTAQGMASPPKVIGMANLQPKDEVRWKIVVPNRTLAGGGL